MGADYDKLKRYNLSEIYQPSAKQNRSQEETQGQGSNNDVQVGAIV